ncbi:MAG: ATP-dependent DNA helicase [Candidatus Nanopelagicales bacterium]|nr:ATP-dependent DNA helicase [Candidatus Nanopelagicales bacterium]MDZ4248839.1 ATP-dependent DNA helicase [Candidatus Nanopelagicales bacterium]
MVEIASLELLDPVQLKLVDHSSGPLLALGAPGTGKTACLIHASVRLTRRMGTDGVLGVTTGRMAARSWQASAARLLGGAAPPVTTAHGLAWRVLDRHPGPHGAPRLLTAPEQESRIRQMLHGSLGARSVDWPREWLPALTTRGFALQLRRAAARVRGMGWHPDEIVAEANRVGDQGWRAVGQFVGEYLRVLDWEGCLDYTEALNKAVAIVESSGPGAVMAGAAGAGGPGLNAVLVDDLHDSDPLQLRLFAGAVAEGGLLIATADPDQSVFGFRGADMSVLSRFAELAGAVPPLVLPVTYRCPAEVRRSAEALMGGRWYPGIPPCPRLRVPATVVGDGRVDVAEFDDENCQAAHVAALLRQERRDGAAWSDMVVLVRSPAREIPVLVRHLTRAGIPVNVPANDVPLSQQPAVDALLSAAQLIADSESAVLGSEAARQILVSPVGGVLETDLSRLGRWLAHRQSAEPGATVCWGEVLRDPQALADVPGDLREVARQVAAVGQTLTRALSMVADRRPASDLLWHLWFGQAQRSQLGGSWPDRLERQAERAGTLGAVANRDLDSLVSLFRLADRADERTGTGADLRSFVADLRAQEIPAEPDVQTTSYQDTVRVMSVFRSRGLQWPVVVVCGLVEGNWPAGRPGSGLIGLERLTGSGLADGPVSSVGAAEERRLLYLALTRASRRAILCAYRADGSDRSRFIDNIPMEVRSVRGYPEQGPAVESVVVALREAATDPEAGAWAARKLAILREVTDPAGRAVFAAADPRNWVGVRDWTVAEAPMRPTDEPLALSASAVAAVVECPFRWFLGKEAKGAPPGGEALEFGLIVHEAVAEMITDSQAGKRTDLDELLSRKWIDGGHEAAWRAASERGLAREALGRAEAWLSERGGGVTSELKFEVEVPLEGSPAGVGGSQAERVRLRGSFDAVEVDDQGCALVWDFKTKRSKTSTAEAESHAQLAVYQIAIQSGAAAEFGAERCGGAGLVHLCVATGTKDDRAAVRVQPSLGESDGGSWARKMLGEVAAVVREERFDARLGSWCRYCDFVSACPKQSGGAR